jgi:hypothetical protein
MGGITWEASHGRHHMGGITWEASHGRHHMICACVYACMCMHVWSMFVYLYVRVCVCVYTLTYTYIHFTGKRSHVRAQDAHTYPHTGTHEDIHTTPLLICP